MEFSYGGLTLNVPDSVYQPSDDSFMLADAAKGLHGDVLEIGCGSGVVSLVVAKTAKKVLGVDINPDAVACAKANAEKNSITNAQFIRGDLFSPLGNKKFDGIVFNPPYLPTNGSERVRGPLNHAFDGGKDGRAVLDRFLAQFGSHLKSGGRLLLVQSSLNDLDKTRQALEHTGYTVAIASQKAFFFEKIYVLKAQRRA
jgi:release factor glutamine methyltransferase